MISSVKTLLITALLIAGAAMLWLPLNTTYPISVLTSSSALPTPDTNRSLTGATENTTLTNQAGVEGSCTRVTEWVFQDDGAHSPQRQCIDGFDLALTYSNNFSSNTSSSSRSSSSTNISASCLALAQSEIQPLTAKFGYWDLYFSCDGIDLPAIMYGGNGAGSGGGCSFGVQGVISGDMHRDAAMAPADVLAFVQQAVALLEANAGGSATVGGVTGKTRCNGTSRRRDANGQTIVWWVGSGGAKRGLELPTEWWLIVVFALGVVGLW